MFVPIGSVLSFFICSSGMYLQVPFFDATFVIFGLMTASGFIMRLDLLFGLSCLKYYSRRLKFWPSLEVVGGPKFSSLLVPGNHWTMLFGENSQAIGDIISGVIATSVC